MRRLMLVLTALCLVVLGPRVAAEDGPARDARGWRPGTVAAGLTDTVVPRPEQPVALPDAIAERVVGPTFLFYFSPTCPHCQEAMPEVNALAESLAGELAFLGISSGGATQAQLADFVATYGVAFPVMLDGDRAFARAVGVRTTPTVLVVEPREDGIAAVDGYMPWYVGAGHVLRMRRNPGQPFASFEPGRYQGRHVCATCHTEESSSWQLTHHAVAYRTLFLRERAEDLACVGCHVTGLGEPGGFEVGDHGSALHSVGCEACHSAGGPHDGERVDASTTCEGCHDADHSIAFRYEKGLPHINHFAATGVDKDELKRRLQALYDGEAPRPLLAFPEGENVGSAACKSCHSAEHKDWKRSPHRDAMASLTADDAAKVDCVRCHASPVSSGPEPTTLAGFRVDDGVGCESCHGPGEQHVAAPTADNILGLGESCPECVIEAVCTSCHTPTWDPHWSLDERLDAVRHGER